MGKKEKLKEFIFILLFVASSVLDIPELKREIMIIFNNN